MRAGVSTRGFGGGIGPVSAGTSWKKSGCGGLLAALLALTVVYYAIAWPWYAGRALARSNGLNPTGQSVTAWILEALYVVAALLVIAALATKSPVPGVIGVAMLGLGFLIAALIHGQYNYRPAALAHPRAECNSSLRADVAMWRCIGSRADLPLNITLDRGAFA